ncbi:hypothetical protein [Nonomuraea sp. NPDC049758]|uniref:hypothetical protein n=1 Tax=Nonomuraea sp. NPDC049758 TaxID=3154360 RepID=UPI00343C488A
MYAINPPALARYRERHTVARAKSDHADAMTLANILRIDATTFSRLSVGALHTPANRRDRPVQATTGSPLKATPARRSSSNAVRVVSAV